MLRSRILEAGCNIIRLQETKREVFDQTYIKFFCPTQFNCFEYIPSIGASGVTRTIWKSSRFNGRIIFQNWFAMSIEFTSAISDDQWVLTNIYAPCTPEGKQQLLDWFHNIGIDDEVEWLLVGDFNLIRRPNDRNKPGGNVQEMSQFNAALSTLRLEELQLIGNKYTWTSKQESPLLEHLDWFFASISWMTSYPGSMVKTLSRDTSDHCPCLVMITTDISKAKVFRFETFGS
jgi:exonuclease III